MAAVALPLAVVVLLLLVAASCCSAGRDFYVGGRGGWAANPAEPFNRWAERNRFQVNDRLVFRYSSHDDSVLVVSQSHYDACNTTEPFLRLDGGDSVFVLSNSGPFFFISGDAGRCQAGERLVVVVLAVRGNRGTTPAPPSTPPPPPAPAAKSSPPVPAPPPASSQTSPPPPPPPAAGNSTSPGTALAPPPATNGTASPPSPSSAPAASRGGFLMCLVMGAAATFLA